MKAFRNGASAFAIVAASGFAPITAMAADQNSSPQTVSTLGEIVVTAQKTAQKLQDVPLSVSAITGKEIDRRNVVDLKDMESSVPGLSTVGAGPGTSFVQIRGVSNTLGAPTVGIYLDEMPVNGTTQNGTIDVRMLDLQRVEVLRGPQGTLYGEGSMGGTIRYITASPDLERVSGNAEGEVSTVEDGGQGYRANGVLNVPIIKGVLGARFVVAGEKDAGWIDDVLTGKKNVNDANFLTFRGKFLFEPTSGTKITLLALHQEVEQAYQNVGIDGVTSTRVLTTNNERYNLFNGVLNQDLGFANLLVSLGYLADHKKTARDLTPTFLPLLEAAPPFGLGLPTGFISAIGLPSNVVNHVYTSEARLSSKGGTPFNWTAGFYYRDSDTSMRAETETAPGSLGLTLYRADSNLKSKAWAMFGEASYQFTPQLNALVGLRYYHDQRDQWSNSAALGFPAHDVNSADFHSLNPRFNLRYEFSPISMVYVNVAKGFRSGGFNLTSAGGGLFQIPPSFGPDSLWSYEVGTKQQFFGRKLEIQASVYYQDWKNVQSYDLKPGVPVNVVVNSGRVSGWGLDWQGTWHATPNLDLSATYGWNNLAYDNDSADKNKGDPVDFAVRESASASLDYHRPIGDNTGFFRLDYLYAGKSQSSIRNLNNQVQHHPARSTLNARIGMDMSQFEVSLFANNLTNNREPILIAPVGAWVENFEQQPRAIGVNVKAQF